MILHQSPQNVRLREQFQQSMFTPEKPNCHALLSEAKRLVGLKIYGTVQAQKKLLIWIVSLTQKLFSQLSQHFLKKDVFV